MVPSTKGYKILALKFANNHRNISLLYYQIKDSGPSTMLYKFLNWNFLYKHRMYRALNRGCKLNNNSEIHLKAMHFGQSVSILNVFKFKIYGLETKYEGTFLKIE